MTKLAALAATNTDVREIAVPDESKCAVEITVGVIGGKWKPIILFHIFTGELVRFSEIKRRLPQVSDRMLTRQLKELEADGLVVRDVRATVPLRVEYSLTEEGKSIVPVLQAMSEWGNRRQSQR